MMKKLLTALFLLLTAAAACVAQNIEPGTPEATPTPSATAPVIRDAPAMPQILALPKDSFGFETKEQRAARINFAIQQSVMKSVDGNLAGYKPPVIPREWRPFVALGAFAAGMLLTNPFSIPFGYYPMKSSTNPFTIAKIPGMAPFENDYSPEHFPQAVRAEFDPVSGKYKQVMVDWSEYQSSLSRSMGEMHIYESVPQIPVTGTERMMMR